VTSRSSEMTCHEELYRLTIMCSCEGVVPSNGEVDISVVFCPTSFQTATAKLQLKISQYLSEPLVCTILGQSAPGLPRSLQFIADTIHLSYVLSAFSVRYITYLSSNLVLSSYIGRWLDALRMPV